MVHEFGAPWDTGQKLRSLAVPANSDPPNLGSCMTELVALQLMVGNFRQPRPPRTAVGRQGIQITEPRGCRGAYRRDEGWVRWGE